MTRLTRKFIRLWNNSSVGFRKRIYVLLLILCLLNGGVWFVTLLVGIKFPLLFGLVAIAYGLGLRHGVDADHIAAIDNATRKLLHDGKKPVGVGLFFSLGHATIVLLLTIIVAIFSAYMRSRLPIVSHIGSFVGTVVSSFFLFLIGGINLVTLIHLFKQYKKNNAENMQYASGFIARIFKHAFQTIKHSWQLYPIGALFGLGFDTATEIALLSISATTGVSLLPWPVVLLLPVAFAAGMTLVDSIDGLLMLGAYGWAYISPARKLYYNLSITSLSVLVAFGIGFFELFQLLLPHMPEVVALDLGKMGMAIIALFILCFSLFFTLSFRFRQLM